MKMIKKLRYISLVALFLLSLLGIVGSNGGGGDGGGETGSTTSNNGTAPTINNVELYDVDWNLKYSFTIGDDANFAVYATDSDKDMDCCYITQYYPLDSSIPYYGPDIMYLPSQSEVDMVYWNVNPIEVTGPAGNWRIEFQIEDANGNESDIFKVYTSILESGTGDTEDTEDTEDTILAKTELLEGYWHFYYTIIATWNDYYTLDTITGDTNSQGGYYIYGTDDFGGLVNACYWPDDGNWSLLDPGIIIDKFFAFYTDGSTVLEDSCYYQIDVATGIWSECFTLNGEKTSLSSTGRIKERIKSAIQNEESRLIEVQAMRVTEGKEYMIPDSIRQKYLELKKVADKMK
ncbi:MAG: hypothetical protein JRF35_01890 [Deltaproteobacteria bacterium]|nr:hypothetical protein [Deltaproteobacteria bacterium]MBW2309813.1 hypothetical protein [Deltaproteobacteria bacterium]